MPPRNLHSNGSGTAATENLRRVATTESAPQVTLIVVHTVLLPQLKIFFLKSFLPMVLTLILDVLDHLLDLRLTHRECPITILPFETVVFGTLHESTSMNRLSNIGQSDWD